MNLELFPDIYVLIILFFLYGIIINYNINFPYSFLLILFFFVFVFILYGNLHVNYMKKLKLKI